MISSEAERSPYEFSYSLFDHNPEQWKKIEPHMPRLLHEAEELLFPKGSELTEPITNGFDGLLNTERLVGVPEGLPTIAYKNTADVFLSPDTTIVIVNKGDSVVGFSFAMPIDRMWPDRAEEAASTAYVYLTVRNKMYPGNRIANTINQAMMEELAKKGYSFVERDAKIGIEGHSYSQQLTDELSDSIVATRKHNDWGLDDQLFIRADIQKYLDSR
ncbi:MAG: hypothetical protein ABIO02_04390 [Patescibacteria group bacterium]